MHSLYTLSMSCSTRNEQANYLLPRDSWYSSRGGLAMILCMTGGVLSLADELKSVDSSCLFGVYSELGCCEKFTKQSVLAIP
jgi:hypothetical protein